MTQLHEKLDEISRGFKAQAPEEALEVMHRATEELEASGAADRALGVGDRLPSFELPDSNGRTVRLEELLERGPVVLSFFRGHW